MEFSTHTQVSAAKVKTAALAVGIFTDGILSPSADVIDRASNGAIRAVLKSEFSARAGATLVLRNLPAVAAQRIVLVGLGKQSDYGLRIYARAELAFANACVHARVGEAISALASIACPGTDLRDRARAGASAVAEATYHSDATLGKPDPQARPRLRKFAMLVEREG